MRYTSTAATAPGGPYVVIDVPWGYRIPYDALRRYWRFHRLERLARAVARFNRA